MAEGEQDRGAAVPMVTLMLFSTTDKQKHNNCCDEDKCHFKVDLSSSGLQIC